MKNDRRLATLIERAQRGEAFEAETETFARLECLRVCIERGIPLEAQDVELLLVLLDEVIVQPRLAGRPRSAEQIRKKEAEAYVWGRAEKRKLIEQSTAAKEAGEEAARKMLARYPAPLFMKNASLGERQSVNTIADRLMRRSPHHRQ